MFFVINIIENCQIIEGSLKYRDTRTYIYSRLPIIKRTGKSLLLESIFTTSISLFFVRHKIGDDLQLLGPAEWKPRRIAAQLIALSVIAIENLLYIIFWYIYSHVSTSYKIIFMALHYCLFFGWFPSRYLLLKLYVNKKKKYDLG